MISTDAIMQKLSAWAETEDGKTRIKERIMMARRKGETLASGDTVLSRAQMLKMGTAFAGMVKRRLPRSIADVGGTLTVGSPVEESDGSFSITLQFDQSALHRNSLENDLGYNGVDNIVALFNNGYHAKNYVYGWWNGHTPAGESIYRSGSQHGEYAWVRSQKEREALRFIQDAAEEFNTTYGNKYGITVELGTDYIGD